MSKTDMIRDLRALTQAGLKDCKDALEECAWNMQDAVDLIKKRGQNIVSGSKIAAEGIVRAMEFGSKKMYGMVEVNCVTDFVARMPEMKNLADNCLSSLYSHVLTNVPSWNLTPEVEMERKELVSKTKENIEVRRWWIEEFVGEFGQVFCYIHPNNEDGKIGVLLTLNANSKEVENSEEFQNLGMDLAMQVAAMNPLSVDSLSIDEDVLKRQTSIFEAQIRELNKPEVAQKKILEGKLAKWYKEVCLLDQESVVQQKRSVRDVVDSSSKSLGGKIEVVNFIRCQVGEGLNKKSEDFVDEVSKMVLE